MRAPGQANEVEAASAPWERHLGGTVTVTERQKHVLTEEVIMTDDGLRNGMPKAARNEWADARAYQFPKLKGGTP